MERQTMEALWTRVREQQRRIEELEAARGRSRSPRFLRRAVLVGLSLAAALSITGGAFASIPSADGVITGCYFPASGLVRIIDAATGHCRANERAVSWYATGTPVGAGTITGVLSIGQGGTGSATKSFVDLSTDQTVSGTKSFTSPIAGSITGTANGFTGSLNGDVHGSQSSTVVSGLQGYGISSTAPTSGQVLAFDGSHWTPTTPPAPAAPAYTVVSGSQDAIANEESTLFVYCPSDFPHIVGGGYYDGWMPAPGTLNAGVAIVGEQPDPARGSWDVEYLSSDSANEPLSLYALCSTQ